MISRELFEAYKGRFGEAVALDKLYDSRGSCGECKHFSVIEPENFLNCSELGCEVPSIKHFCAIFERVDNENITK